MTPIVVPYGRTITFPIPTGQDNQTPPQPASVKNLVATIDDYNSAFVNKGSGLVWLVAKVTPPQGGQTIVTVTLSGQNANGDSLPSLQQQFALQGPAAPPLAVSLVDSFAVTINPPDTNYPGDPGSSSVSLS